MMPVFTWRHGGHVGVLLTKEFWLFLLFGTPTWPLCLLSFVSLGIVWKPRIVTLFHLPQPFQCSWYLLVKHTIGCVVFSHYISNHISNYIRKAAVNIPLKTRRSHPLKFLPLHTNSDAYKYSFWPRTIQDWNNLEPVILDINDTKTFKNMIK